MSLDFFVISCIVKFINYKNYKKIMELVDSIRNWFEKQSPVIKAIIYFWIALICLFLVAKIPNPQLKPIGNTSFPRLNASRLETTPLITYRVYSIDVYTRICRDIYLMNLENKSMGNLTCWRAENNTCICVEPL